MGHQHTAFCISLAGLVSLGSVARGQYSTPIAGLDGRYATVSRATSDGRTLVGLSDPGAGFELVTVWRWPEWNAEAAVTPVDTSMGWPQSAQVSWIQGVSDVGGVMSANNPMMDAFIWWDGPNHEPRVYNTEGRLYYADAVSANGTAVIGLASDDDGTLRTCVYRRDGSIGFFESPLAGSEAGVGCVSANGLQFAGTAWQYGDANDPPVGFPAVWLERGAELLPLPAGVSEANVTQISDTGDWAFGWGTLSKEPARYAGVTWRWEVGGAWHAWVDSGFIDERWGKMRGDGRRQIGLTGDDEEFVLRDVYHGDRRLDDVIHDLFAELPRDRYRIITAGTGAGEIVVAARSGGAWALTLPALADLNEDRVLDETDVMLFIAAFAAGERGADWNMDGFVDFTDFDAFIGDFERGG